MLEQKSEIPGPYERPEAPQGGSAEKRRRYRDIGIIKKIQVYIMALVYSFNGKVNRVRESDLATVWPQLLHLINLLHVSTALNAAEARSWIRSGE